MSTGRRLNPQRRHVLAALALAPLLRPAMVTAEPSASLRPWPRNRAAPPLVLPALEGPPWNLASTKGQVVVLNFWAAWCEPCRAEMPSLELLAERHSADGLTVMAVNYREGESTIQRFLERMPITLPILRDADGSAARAWGVRVFPTTVLVGRDGLPAFSVIGELDWTGAQARQWLAPLLARGART